jgi:hypothetical protein
VLRPAALALVTLLAAPAGAAHVYLNGVLIDGVTGEEFTGVQRVVIDADGNVHIDAPQYEIEKQDAQAAQPAPAALTHRYWLVTTAPSEGLAVEIWAGATLVRRIGAGDGPVVDEITSFLRPGPNKLRVKAQKAGEPARSLPVVIGEASVSKNDEVLLSDDRLSFDVAPGREAEQTLVAR